MSKSAVKPSLVGTLLVGVALRVALIVYMSRFEDIGKQQLSGTDIDYKVYTDAAQYASPYLRHTYRYTPLLARLMDLNHIVDYAGKLFFVGFDVLAMVALWLINSSSNAPAILKLYAYNPIFIYLTARGSCESISLALMFWCFYLLCGGYGNVCLGDGKQPVEDRRPHAWLGYVLYGLWVHFRVYPIIFLPLLLTHEYKLAQRAKTSFLSRFLKMSVLSGGVFLGLLGLFYTMYGYEFVEETYLYHLRRLDNRHSFSPIFYEIYLSLNTPSMMRSIAQLCVVLATTRRAHKSISPLYAHFVITYTFVSLNKVITMQYYMWVLGALLLVLPESSLLTNSERRFQKSFSYIMQYSLGILLWVWLSIRLEKDGENVFNLMWLVCIFKLFSDFWAFRGFLSTLKNVQAYQKLPASPADPSARKGPKAKN